MAKKLYEEANIQAIAEAIRNKCGTTCGYKTCDMAAAIDSIETGSAEKGLVATAWQDYANRSVVTNGIYYGTYIPQYGFYCHGTNAVDRLIRLSNITFADALTDIGAWAFSGKENTSAGTYNANPLTGLTTLPDTVTTIGAYAFAGCSCPLTHLPSALTTIGTGAFKRCAYITELTFQGTPTSIAADAFASCTRLTTINVPWAEGAVANAPWGATGATINYNYAG